MGEIEQVFAADGIEAAATVVERLCQEVVASAEKRARMLTDWGANSVTTPRIDILRLATALASFRGEGRLVCQRQNWAATDRHDAVPAALIQLRSTSSMPAPTGTHEYTVRSIFS